MQLTPLDVELRAAINAPGNRYSGNVDAVTGNFAIRNVLPGRYDLSTFINSMVAGGTGAGKTTTLNVISSFIPDDERILTIEDAAELKLQQPHCIRLEARPPNIEGKGQVTIRDLVRNTLRMRPDPDGEPIEADGPAGRQP